jgi:reverse gyrase
MTKGKMTKGFYPVCQQCWARGKIQPDCPNCAGTGLEGGKPNKCKNCEKLEEEIKGLKTVINLINNEEQIKEELKSHWYRLKEKSWQEAAEFIINIGRRR